MMRPKIFFPLCFLSIASTFIYGDSNYWGITGLIRTPTARTIEDGNLRYTFAYGQEYHTSELTFGFLPFLEIGSMLVLPEAWGYAEDRSLNIKLLLINEKPYFPSLSVGVMDPEGDSRQFFTEYVVASKRVGDFDFTLGYGGNLFGDTFSDKGPRFPPGKITARELNGLFAGMEWKVKNNISLLIEYDPTKKTFGWRKDIDHHFNYGLRWNPFRWLTLGYSYQRGTEHNVQFAITYPLGRRSCSEKTSFSFHPSPNNIPMKDLLVEKPLTKLLSDIRSALTEEGFKDADVNLSADMKQLYVEFENRLFPSHIQAVGRILQTIISRVPAGIEKITVVTNINGIPMLQISLTPNDYIAFLNGEITCEEMQQKIDVTGKTAEKVVWQETGYEDKKLRHRSFTCGFEPMSVEFYGRNHLQSMYNIKRFAESSTGPAVSLTQNFGQGLSTEAYVKFPLYAPELINDWTGHRWKPDTPPLTKKAAKNDTVNYVGKSGLSVETLTLNKMFKIKDSNYLLLKGGYSGLKYAELSAEYLKTFSGGRFAVGRELSWGKNRHPDLLFGLDGSPVLAGSLNGYMFLPDTDTIVRAGVGTTLSGENEACLQITRNIRYGKVFLWFSRMESDNYSGDRTTHFDKGIGIVAPINLFGTFDCKGKKTYQFSPGRREPGNHVYKYSLYDYILEFTPAYVLQHLNELKE